jgi:4-hydroxy-L-threonine phosphate dehydrogenase PdxA
LKNYKPIIIVAGEPNSIFFEIFFKIMKNNNFKSPIILIGSKNLLQKNIKFFKSKIDINEIKYSKKDLLKTNLNKINLINIEYNQKKIFEKISTKSNKYIGDSFKIAIEILNNGITNKLINGPISKKYFLKRKYL